MLLFLKNSKTTTAHGYLLFAHSQQTKSTQNKPNAKGTKTAHCRQFVSKPTKEQKGSSSTQCPKKQKWRAERYALNAAGDEGQTGSRVSNARRNGNVTDGKSSERRNGNGTDEKSSEKRATQRNGTVGKERAGNEVGKNYVSRPQQKTTKQPSQNSKTNLSHTLGRRREATARQSSIIHYGA